MATRNHTVRAMPADLAAALSLTAGTTYTIENLGDGIVKVAILGDTPAASFRAHELKGHSANLFSFTASERPYVWLRNAQDVAITIVVSETV